MHGLTAATILQIALFATNGSEYQEAYNKAEKAGKPLLVLVGPEQSPDCRAMKQKTLPELKRAGGLDNVVYTEVDSDTNPNLSGQMLRSGSLPQLVLYTPVGKLWRRTHISGAKSQSEIRAFLQREIAKGREVAKAARETQTTVMYSPSTTYSYSSGSS